MDVSGISSTSSTPPAVGGGTALGKDDFLKLLMAQLGHQDPLSPMDSQAFLAQLAQFASVEQMQAQSQQLDALLVAQASSNQLQAASLVGKEAVVQSDTIEHGGADTTVAGTLSGAASRVTLTVKDASGRTVRTVELGALPAGPVSWVWNGLGDDGPQPPGTYTVSLTAADAAGNNVPAQTQVRSRVTGVSFEAGYAQLVLANGQKVSLSGVSQLNEAERNTQP